MTETRTLHLDILPPAQQLLWHELRTLPEHFVLYGGTAIALQLGHRTSVDFDFFSTWPLSTSALDLALPLLRDAVVTQRAPDTLSCIVDRGDPVKVSFFGVPKLPRILPPLIAADHGLRIASLLDLAGTKASVVQMRAESKDYLDLDAILQHGRIDLATALASAACLYGARFNPQVSLKALTFFDEGDLADLPEAVKQRLTRAVRNTDPGALPKLPEPFYSGAT